MRDIKRVAQSAVRESSWNRMLFQKMLLFSSVLLVVGLCLMDRYELNENRYDSFLDVNGTCAVNNFPLNLIYSSWEKKLLNSCYENIVTRGEYMRIIVLYLFMSVLNAYKNAWK